MIRKYRVQYKDILNRVQSFCLERDDDEQYLDLPALRRVIPERMAELIQYPCTIPWVCFLTHDGDMECNPPFRFCDGEFEQSEPIKCALKDPYKDGVAFQAALRRKELPEEWWNGFRDAFFNAEESAFLKEMDDEVRADQAAGIAYDQEHQPWGDTVDS